MSKATSNTFPSFASAYRQDTPRRATVKSSPLGHFGIPAKWYVAVKCTGCEKKFECGKVPHVVTRRAVESVVTPKIHVITAAEAGIT